MKKLIQHKPRLALMVVFFICLITAWISGAGGWKFLGVAVLFSTLILSLVLIHELGHYIPGRIFGIRIEKFSIGLPPRLFSFQIGQTTYQIGLIPLGGFVKFGGIPEDHAEDSYFVRNGDYQNKPTWQKIIVMSGGVMANFLAAITVLTLLNLHFGKKITPINQLSEGIYVQDYILAESQCGEAMAKETLGHRIGLRTGDSLVSINGQKARYMEDFYLTEQLLKPGAFIEVSRQGKIIKLAIPSAILQLLNNQDIANYLFDPNYQSRIAVSKNSPAEQAGIQNGDLIQSLGDHMIGNFYDLQDAIHRGKGKIIPVVLTRGERTLALNVDLSGQSIMGVRPAQIIRQDTLNYGMQEAIQASFHQCLSFIFLQKTAFSQIISGKAGLSDALEGPVGIARLVSRVFFRRDGTYNWHGLLTLFAYLNLILIISNLLPLSILDGGQIIILLGEWISGRMLSFQTKYVLGLVSAGIVFLLMVTVIFHDITKVLVC